jgi:hypothetical protein
MPRCSEEDHMSIDGFKKAAAAFQGRKLHENSPLEGPITGFSRYDRDMSPQTREMVLRSRMPEILAFSEDRKLDPAVVAGVVEASMRMGRIPDLGMYGLAGDEALAVKDFVATSMLGLEHQLAHGLPVIAENEHPKAKHGKFAQHYKGLADKHKAAMDWYNKAASEANKNGQPFTAAKHQAMLGKLKALHAAHSALADYHNLEAGDAIQGQQAAVPQGAGPTHVDQPTGAPEKPAHPQPGSTAAQAPKVPAAPKVEATQALSASPIMQMPTAFLKRPVSQTQYNTWSDKDEGDALGDEPGDGEQDDNREQQSFRGGHRAALLDDMIAGAVLTEEKKDKKKSEKKSSAKTFGKKSDPDKTDKALANVKCAPLFQQLGHKMDHAEAKVTGKKVKSEWAQKLWKKCLSEGGGAASDEVVKASLIEPWIRDQGFVDESANLRAKWSTLMSAETRENAIKASPTTPEPIVFTVNRMIDMASGKGSVY